jgi:hypothetical protein
MVSTHSSVNTVSRPELCTWVVGALPVAELVELSRRLPRSTRTGKI